jgi:exonuclease III
MLASGKNNQFLKIYGITKLRTDEIFLSDIRVRNRNLISAEDDLKRLFLHNPYGQYDLYFNSSSNKRGVGILIRKKIPVAVLRERADPGENYLLLELEMSGKKAIVGSIYGPNVNDPVFFENLERDLRDLGGQNIILGGDFNCTFSTDFIRTNIDCLNMVNPPNRTHSLLLADLCERLQLTDPYRVINPNKKEFTFVPRTADAVNRSRIDFFLVSTNLILNGIDCTIAPNLQNKLFDHKACFLTLKKPICERRPNKPVDSKILEHDITEYVIFAAVSEAYAVHPSNDDLAVNDQRAALRSIGQLKKLIREIGPPMIPPDALVIDNGLAYREGRDVLIRCADLFRDEINRLNLTNLRVVPDPDVFFETLLGMIKNDLISYQVYARYLENKSFKDLK